MLRRLMRFGGFMFLAAILAIALWKDGGKIRERGIGSDAALKEVAAKAAKLNESSERPTLEQLVETYKGLGLIDTHNHDASNFAYAGMLNNWKRNGIERVVLFGSVSEPSAVRTDEMAWNAYRQQPDRFIPYFSGFNLHDPSSLDVVKNNLEQGFFGLGEVAGASLYSPLVSKSAWKAEHPMDGYLPQIYELIATYKAPILLHIDPPRGMPIAKLEQALDEHPNTIFIFGHMNVFNIPKEIDRILAKHRNLYADFFAGFSVYNLDNGIKVEQFIPVIRKYLDRFMLSTDSGFGIENEEQAIDAMYRLIHLIDDPFLAKKIAHDNLDALIRAQPATKTQLEAIHKLERDTGKKYHLNKLSKVEAGKILAESGRK